VVAVVV
jgi:hypothetical protein